MSEISDKIKILALKTAWNKWPAPVVARSEVRKFTGGIFSPRTLANLDSKGEGPRGRLRLGRKVCYPKNELIEWLLERLDLEV